MSAIEYAYRIEITAHGHDGYWYALVWQLVNPQTGTHHESACYWSTIPGNAKHVWQQLESGRTPSELHGTLDGWQGLHISPVQQLRRFARPEGWGPWELHVPAIQGTREIRTGSCAARGTDLRQDTDRRESLGLPAPTSIPAEVHA